MKITHCTCAFCMTVKWTNIHCTYFSNVTQQFSQTAKNIHESFIVDLSVVKQSCVSNDSSNSKNKSKRFATICLLLSLFGNLNKSSKFYPSFVVFEFKKSIILIYRLVGITHQEENELHTTPEFRSFVAKHLDKIVERCNFTFFLGDIKAWNT